MVSFAKETIRRSIRTEMSSWRAIRGFSFRKLETNLSFNNSGMGNVSGGDSFFDSVVSVIYLSQYVRCLASSLPV